jgi:Ser-Thr-rich glycosyl-phosphatidyl-inositol-anchored membrane family
VSLIDRAKNLAGSARAALDSPAAATVLFGDTVVVTAPPKNTTWTPGDRVTVSWTLKGVTANDLGVALVRVKGTRVHDVAVLAAAIAPTSLNVQVTVPDVPPGHDYAIEITSDDPLIAHSPNVTIAAKRAD